VQGEPIREDLAMSTGTTVTCTCGYQGFIVVDAKTGQQVDLKTYFATVRRDTFTPDNMKRHDPIDASQLVMVCANPNCRRTL
jgi:hypothetical protein